MLQVLSTKRFFLWAFIAATQCAVACPADTSKLKRKAPPEIVKNCEKQAAVEIIIEEAIATGAPTYNDGNHIACYRIYEGAAYKILYKYGSKCKDIKNTLETALEKSYGDYTTTEKAWIMRMAFDKILGVATSTTK